jgi:hypothetical protein
MPEYAALVASPRALPDGLILVFQYPVNLRVLRVLRGSSTFYSSRFKLFLPLEPQVFEHGRRPDSVERRYRFSLILLHK